MDQDRRLPGTWTIIITDLHSDDNLRVKDPSLSLSHYISTLALLLSDHDLNFYVCPEPQLKL